MRRLRSWWKKIKQHPIVMLLNSFWQQIKHHKVKTLLIPFLIALVLTILMGGYKLNWNWTGLTGTTESYKTLYDWLQLLFVPVALTGFGFFLNYRERKAAEQRADKEQREEARRAANEQKAADRRAEEELKQEQQRAETERGIATDNQHEAALQVYIDNMSALLLEQDLSNPVDLDKVRKVGRIRTLTVLRRCDGKRKAIVLQFLCESDLINKDNQVVDLDGTDFSGAELFLSQLSKTDLSRANLTSANLSEANLFQAKLCSTILIKSKLCNAKLFGADLRGVDLSEANLSGATITMEQLAQAKTLKGATMPDGSIHP